MSYILEALRKSERQRREIEDAPLVRLTTAANPRRSRWRPVALGLSVITNVAVLVYLFGPARQQEGLHERTTFEPLASGSMTTGQTPPAVQPAVGSPSVPGDPSRKAENAEIETAERAGVPSPAKPGTSSSAGKTAEVRSNTPVTPAARAARENARQRTVMARRSLPSPDSPAMPGEFPTPAIRPTPKHSVTDFGRPPSAELSVPAADGLPRPNINVYAYTARADGDRFVIIRNRRYREGDRIEEGPIVRRIEEHAMTLEFAGHTYKIPRP